MNALAGGNGHRRTVKTKTLSRWQVFGLADIQHACFGAAASY